MEGGGTLEFRVRPCAGERVCPWRRDADLTAYTDQDMRRLIKAGRGDTRDGAWSQAEAEQITGGRRMACHLDQPDTAHPLRLCAGWLAGCHRPAPLPRPAQHAERPTPAPGHSPRHHHLAAAGRRPGPARGAARQPAGRAGNRYGHTSRDRRAGRRRPGRATRWVWSMIGEQPGERIDVLVPTALRLSGRRPRHR
ncbi:hypothetical protein ACWEPN_40050 [Nonomuraea wenchangensis]